jgi:hypothetical protein
MDALRRPDRLLKPFFSATKFVLARKIFAGKEISVSAVDGFAVRPYDVSRC